MSLLNGMNDMLANKAAMEAANDIALFEEDFAMEADETIDAMVDGEIEELIEEDEDEDEIIGELDDEDNSIASANESAVDPEATKPGSIGASSVASSKDNFTSTVKDTNDPITTKPGSIGANSSANPENNFSDASADNNDPIDTEDGQKIGDQKATAKDPVLESADFFRDLMGLDVANEGVVDKIKQNRIEKNENVRKEKLSFIGMKDIDSEKIDNLLKDGKYDAALKIAAAYGKELESKKGSIPENDADATKKCKVIDSLLKTNSSLMVKIQRDKLVKKYLDQGMDTKEASKKANAEMKSNAKGKAMESIIFESIDMIAAFEEANDPEATKPGSIGADSSANPENNFSDASADNNDPVDTSDGKVGQDDSKATFDDNFSDGLDDNNDPIDTVDGSVGQKTSTAKDPASESTIIDDELEALNKSLEADFEDDFDLDDDDDLI